MNTERDESATLSAEADAWRSLYWSLRAEVEIAIVLAAQEKAGLTQSHLAAALEGVNRDA